LQRGGGRFAMARWTGAGRMLRAVDRSRADRRAALVRQQTASQVMIAVIRALGVFMMAGLSSPHSLVTPRGLEFADISLCSTPKQSDAARRIAIDRD
jgi:hypothetical protein